MLKNIPSFVMGLIGLLVFAAMIFSEVYLPHVSAKFEVLVAAYGVLMAGEMILLGMKNNEGR